MRLAAALILTSLFVFAQPEKLQFEAASVKPSPPPSGRGMRLINGRGGPGSNDPGRIRFSNASLAQIVARAYDIKNYQLIAPDWLNQERFDIDAKVPEGATKEQANIMLQNLLAERFHMTVQHGSKEFQGYSLVVGKGGPRMKESSQEDAAFDQSKPREPGARPLAPRIGPDGRMELPKQDRPGLMIMMRMSPKGAITQLSARAQTIQQLRDFIMNHLSRPVADNTGLTGKYDFSLEFSGDAPMGMGGMLPPPPPPLGGNTDRPSMESPEDLAPALPTALQQQLGLRLESKKISVPTVTVEKADKVPTEN
ncbi:MAG TPA: TIGR03435 family protein [Bryobacteraceae bacterium]|jgi:uncharacterized protein (TIGR03435 family)|nr:TIGR03435 family protein [Bryobacteraceae bacterium]